MRFTYLTTNILFQALASHLFYMEEEKSKKLILFLIINKK
jgi:hypothetical protein